MAEKDGKPPVRGNAEKGKEETEGLKKSVEELSTGLESEKLCRAALQERFDEIDREKLRLARRAEMERNRAEIYREELNDATDRLEKEMKRREENEADYKEKEKVRLGEKEVLRGKNEVLQEENEVLKGEVAGLRRTLDECESEKRRVEIENEELRRRLREIEEEKVSSQFYHSMDNRSMIPSFTRRHPIKREEKPIDLSASTPDDNEFLALDFAGNDLDFKEEEMLNGEGMDLLDEMAPREEENGSYAEFRNPSNEVAVKEEVEEVEMGGGRASIPNDLIGNEEEEDREDSNVDQSTYSSKNSHEDGEVERKKRPSRNSSKSVRYTEPMEDSDEDGSPSMKKSKSESRNGSEMKRQSSLKRDQSLAANKAKMNNTDLECTECDYRTRTANAFVMHLRRNHKTSLLLAGLALRCDCGHESYSQHHCYECHTGNVTIIIKKDGPIQRLDDEKVTPQCILCEAYPKTARGYIAHLSKHHNKTTLKDNGICLICSCGFEMHSVRPGHSEECNGRQYTLHKVDEK